MNQPVQKPENQSITYVLRRKEQGKARKASNIFVDKLSKVMLLTMWPFLFSCKKWRLPMADFFSYCSVFSPLPPFYHSPHICKETGKRNVFWKKGHTKEAELVESNRGSLSLFFKRKKNLDPCRNISSHTSHSPDARLMCKLLHSTRNRATSISYGERALVRINWWHVLVLSASRLSTYLERKRIDMMQIIDKFSSCVNITEVSFGGAVVH